MKLIIRMNLITQAVDYFLYCYDKVNGMMTGNDTDAEIIRVDTSELAEYAKTMRKQHFEGK